MMHVKIWLNRENRVDRPSEVVYNVGTTKGRKREDTKMMNYDERVTFEQELEVEDIYDDIWWDEVQELGSWLDEDAELFVVADEEEQQEDWRQEEAEAELLAAFWDEGESY